MRDLHLDSAYGADIAQLKADLRAAGYGPKAWDKLKPTDALAREYTATQEKVVRKLQRDANGAVGPVDGIFGEQTRRYLESLLKANLETRLRAEIVRLAKVYEGVKEVGGNNRGPEVEMFQRWAGGVASDLRDDAWCAAFCDFVVENAYINLGLRGKWPLSIGLGCTDFVTRAMAKDRVRHAKLGRPGDLFVYYGKTVNGKRHFRHIGIVTEVADGATMLYTIEGNTTKPGARGNFADGGGVYAKTPKPSQGVCVDLCSGVA